MLSWYSRLEEHPLGKPHSEGLCIAPTCAEFAAKRMTLMASPPTWWRKYYHRGVPLVSPSSEFETHQHILQYEPPATPVLSLSLWCSTLSHFHCGTGQRWTQCARARTPSRPVKSTPFRCCFRLPIPHPNSNQPLPTRLDTQRHPKRTSTTTYTPLV